MAHEQGAAKVAIASIPDIPEGVDLDALGNEARHYARADSAVYVGAEMTLDEFKAWFAKQPLGTMPYNAVGFHHTYKPNEQEWRGLTTLAGVFRYYNQTLGWSYGYGPHIFLYAGDGPYKSGQKLVYVATHPQHDGVAIAYRNQRFLHIECVGYYDSRPMPKAMQELAGDVLGVVCGRRNIPIKDIGAGWDAPANPAGVVLHRNAPNAGKSCPGWQVKTLPKPSARPAPAKPPSGTLYRVRCGSFSVRANAEALYAKLKKAGFGGVVASEAGAYNVYAGSFSVRANADKLVADLKRKGFEAVVIQKGAAPKPAPKKPAPTPTRPASDPRVDYSLWAPHVAAVAREFWREFGIYVDTYPGHGTTGRAYGMDAWISPQGQKANKEQEALGDRIQKYVETHWRRLRVHYAIYWEHQNWGNGWTFYDPSVYDKGSGHPITKKHLDHFHLQILA